MLTITSPHNPTIKLIRTLGEKRHRQEHGLFIAEGEKVLDRARREGWEPDYLLTTTHAEPWGNASLMRIDDKMMGTLSAQKNPPRQLGVFRQRWCPYADPKGCWVALEDMRDPGNLGTMLRTADAAGATGIILVGQSCDPWGPDWVRATMGSILGVPLVRLASVDFLDLCRAWPGESVGISTRSAVAWLTRRPWNSSFFGSSLWTWTEFCTAPGERHARASSLWSWNGFSPAPGARSALRPPFCNCITPVA